jgi:hypothetical protein
VIPVNRPKPTSFLIDVEIRAFAGTFRVCLVFPSEAAQTRKAPCRPTRPSKEKAVGLESVYFVGAFLLLAALIYGVLNNRYRNRAADRAGDKVVRERYRRNET